MSCDSETLFVMSQLLCFYILLAHKNKSTYVENVCLQDVMPCSLVCVCTSISGSMQCVYQTELCYILQC